MRSEIAVEKSFGEIVVRLQVTGLISQARPVGDRTFEAVGELLGLLLIDGGVLVPLATVPKLSEESRTFVEALRTPPEPRAGSRPSWVLSGPIRRGRPTPIEDRLAVLRYAELYSVAAATIAFGISAQSVSAWRKEVPPPGERIREAKCSCGQPVFYVCVPGDSEERSERGLAIAVEAHEVLAHHR